MSAKEQDGSEVTQERFDAVMAQLEKYDVFVGNLFDIARTGSIAGHTVCEPPYHRGMFHDEEGKPTVTVQDFHGYLVRQAEYFKEHPEKVENG